jgi:hypothetical protein
MRRRAAASVVAPLVAIALSAATGSPGVAASTRKCQANFSDAAAKELARTAETGAETIATDYEGSYTHVTPAALRAELAAFGGALLPTSRRAAVRAHVRAYLLSASGTTDSYLLITRAFDGDTYAIQRDRDGEIARTARVCGKKVREW